MYYTLNTECQHEFYFHLKFYSEHIRFKPTAKNEKQKKRVLGLSLGAHNFNHLKPSFVII